MLLGFSFDQIIDINIKLKSKEDLSYPHIYLFQSAKWKLIFFIVPITITIIVQQLLHVEWYGHTATQCINAILWRMTFSLTPRKYALLVQCCSQKMKHCIHIQIKLRVNTRTYFCYKDEVHYIEKVLKFTCDIIRCLLNIPSRKHKNAFVVRNTWVIQQAYIPMVYTWFILLLYLYASFWKLTLV